MTPSHKISDEAHAERMAERRARQLARFPGWWRSPGPGGGTRTGRNHSGAAIGRLKAKWLVQPRPDQIHPERHRKTRSRWGKA